MTTELLRAANIGEDEFAAFAVRIDDGKVLLAHGAERDMQPASTLKTLTAIVGLERLGPPYRARTALLATAGILHGRLDGNLYLKGGGSPDFDWQALRRMLEQLRFAGVRRITGDVVLDRTYFQPPRADVGVPPFDETPEFRYNVIPDALELNTNLIELDLSSVGGKGVRAQLTPRLDRVGVDASALAPVDMPCEKWEDRWQLPSVRALPGGRLRIALHGGFPRACAATTRINVIERNVFADRLFRSLWRSLGGRFDGRVVEGATPREARVLAAHDSRTLAEFLREVLKRSDNPIARQVYLALGARAPETPEFAGLATAARAERVVRAWLAAHGLDDAGLVLENGSGLSRRERIRPRLLAGVLAAAARSPWAPEFQATLPIVGVDAAMRNRLRESPAAGRGRFKTGGLRNVASVAGYVPDAAGRLHAVVAIVNHDGPKGEWGKGATAALDSVIDWVARSDAP